MQNLFVLEYASGDLITAREAECGGVGSDVCALPVVMWCLMYNLLYSSAGGSVFPSLCSAL